MSSAGAGSEGRRGERSGAGPARSEAATGAAALYGARGRRVRRGADVAPSECAAPKGWAAREGGGRGPAAPGSAAPTSRRLPGATADGVTERTVSGGRRGPGKCRCGGRWQGPRVSRSAPRADTRRSGAAAAGTVREPQRSGCLVAPGALPRPWLQPECGGGPARGTSPAGRQQRRPGAGAHSPPVLAPAETAAPSRRDRTGWVGQGRDPRDGGGAGPWLAPSEELRSAGPGRFLLRGCARGRARRQGPCPRHRHPTPRGGPGRLEGSGGGGGGGCPRALFSGCSSFQASTKIAVYFAVGSRFGGGGGGAVQARGALCPGLALQRAVFSLTRVPHSLTRKDNSRKGNSAFGDVQLSPKAARVYRVVPWWMAGWWDIFHVSVKQWTEPTGRPQRLPPKHNEISLIRKGICSDLAVPQLVMRSSRARSCFQTRSELVHQAPRGVTGLCFLSCGTSSSKL
ncbi:translation initiation factor IF-2-like [Falco naumanni]|uniref:translation initiation factor IF-2-like n=1 Tax=Falco naumanni TaxID=148594 RepID=UPI001ADE5390|nr:translation initiation factor IF-2-like [Falco naumanni]